LRRDREQARPACARRGEADAHRGGFQSEIWLSRSGRRVNAKSIMGVMMLAAGLGTTVQIEAQGGDAEQAISAITKLIADKFGEGE
jgi:phosphocarrier protein